MDDKVAVIGLGRLGFPLAVALAHRGFKVFGIDIDPDVVDAVNAHRVLEHICEPGLQEMLGGTENLIGTTDMEAAAFAPISIVIVNTPSEPDGSFSLKYVLSVCRELGGYLRERTVYHTVIISSTVMPGDCDGPIRAALEETSGRKVGDDLGLCCCPEFVALGNILRGFLEPDFVLVGSSDIKADFQVGNLYKRFCLNDPPIVQASLVNAEIAKIALNCYITTKITFANQVAELCEQIPGASVDAVTGILGLDSRIGRKYLTGATAYGGNCFPRDTKSMACVGERAGVELSLIKEVEKVNNRQNERLARLIHNYREQIKAERVGILGLTFKPDTNVTTESAGVALVRLLHSLSLVAYDPAVQAEQLIKSIEALKGYQDIAVISTPWLAESAQACVDCSDIVVITTPWPEFEGVEFHERQVVIDCWRMLDKAKVEDAGAQYVAIGVGPCKES